MAAAEFHATNDAAVGAEDRVPAAQVTSQGRPYKAVVVVFLNGGCDSFNLLVPYSGCEANIGRDLYEEYSTVRSVAALGKNQLFEIDVPAGTQPCDKFGVHKSIPVYRDQYVLGNLAFLANIGTLVRHVLIERGRYNTTISAERAVERANA
jgi:cullin-associated NEDD8-dissociated protein 1